MAPPLARRRTASSSPHGSSPRWRDSLLQVLLQVHQPQRLATYIVEFPTRRHGATETLQLPPLRYTVHRSIDAHHVAPTEALGALLAVPGRGDQASSQCKSPTTTAVLAGLHACVHYACTARSARSGRLCANLAIPFHYSRCRAVAHLPQPVTWQLLQRLRTTVQQRVYAHRTPRPHTQATQASPRSDLRRRQDQESCAPFHTLHA